MVEYCAGEERTWCETHLPTVGEEDRRRLHRELETLKHEQIRLSNRIKGLLASQGLRVDQVSDFLARLQGTQASIRATPTRPGKATSSGHDV